MRILGLTGGIGMGKSTAAAMLRRMRIPVFDADDAVHRLLGRGGAAVAAVAAAFPGVATGGGAIDRKKLGARVFGSRAELKRLEVILHPLVGAAERRFLARLRAERRRVAALEVPLLFETGGERRCAGVAVVWAPASVQRARVLARPGMTAARLAFLRAHQMSERERRRRADFLVPSGLGRAATWRGLERAVRAVAAEGWRRRRGHAKRRLVGE